MKVSKAIEILSTQGAIDQLFESPDTADAIQLGIEALKRHQDLNRVFKPRYPFLLPGETPEDE